MGHDRANKLFDYMAAGLAVVTSDAAPFEADRGGCGCGLVYRDRDAEACARALRRLRDATGAASGRAWTAAIERRTLGARCRPPANALG